MSRNFFVLLAVLLLSACQWHQRPAALNPDFDRASHAEAGQSPPAPTNSPGGNASDPVGVRSMGIPPKYDFHLGPMVSYDRTDGRRDTGGHVHGGVFRHISNPNYGLGLVGEGYLGSVDGEVDSGVRLLGAFRVLFLQLGLDYSFRHSRPDFICSLNFPLKRGGLLGVGDTFRIDWIPGRNHSFSAGLSIPLGAPHMGKTRPRETQIALPEPWNIDPRAVSPNPQGAPAMELALDRVAHAAHWINRYTTPFLDQPPSSGQDKQAGFRHHVMSMKEHMNQVDEFYPEGHTFHGELAVYHRAMKEAIALALDPWGCPEPSCNQVGRVAAQVRKALLDGIIVPYNRLLGMHKKKDSVAGYGVAALKGFQAWLKEETALKESQKRDLLYVFQRLIGIVEENREASRRVWGDSRLVWIPLHYGLKPEEYDSQENMDALVARVVHESFTEGNEVRYVINERFHAETARTIHLAEDYHVLWIHDYRGLTSDGDPDLIGYAQTLEGYLHAMVGRVRDYDTTGRFPVYMILIDQFYFERNQGRLWLDLLENPMDHVLSLPPGNEELEKEIRAAQQALRSAVEASSRLQEGKQRWGEDYIAGKIKVHVNVINPSDFSFRSRHIMDRLPIAPDNLMRDHRKIVFYDVTELDPGRGEALYGGLGIGERYAGPDWEDRAVLVRGPVLVSLKNAARRVLLQQGFQEGEIPDPLRSQPIPPDYEEMVRALKDKGWQARIMDVHNETGFFYPKNVNVVKAALYNFMPAGSTIIVPDGLWNSPFWGGMLVGAALRGCRVLVIGPAPEEDPESEVVASRTYELLERLILLRSILHEELEAAGGAIKVGSYTRKAHAGDVATKLAQFRDGMRAHPFLREVFPFHDRVYEAMDEVRRDLASGKFTPSHFADLEEKASPRLHLKTNFLVSHSLQSLMAHPGWAEAMKSYLRYRAAREAEDPWQMDSSEASTEAKEEFLKLLGSFRKSFSEVEMSRMISYLTVGSQNQSYRGILMDGEVAVIVSGHSSLIALIDHFFMSGLTTWVEDVQELERLYQPARGLRRWIGYYFRKAI